MKTSAASDALIIAVVDEITAQATMILTLFLSSMYSCLVLHGSGIVFTPNDQS